MGMSLSNVAWAWAYRRPIFRCLSFVGAASRDPPFARSGNEDRGARRVGPALQRRLWLYNCGALQM